LYFVVFGISLFSRGVVAYENCLRAVVYSPVIVMSGALLMLLAVVPDSLVARLNRRGRQRGFGGRHANC
jgi:hypothetical protein